MMYRGMDAAALDRAYDNGAAFPDVPRFRELWLQRSAGPTPEDAMLDLAYGADPLQRLDVFPAGRHNAPTLLFFHGGFWSRNDKATFRFLRAAFIRAGFN